jgi:hypothetical protein
MPVKADDDVEQMKKREEYIMELGAMYAKTHQTQSWLHLSYIIKFVLFRTA